MSEPLTGRLLAAALMLREKVQMSLGAFENNNAIDWGELATAIEETFWLLDLEPEVAPRVERCPVCKGSGEVYDTTRGPNDGGPQVCPSCFGEGDAPSGERNPC